jgi:transcriptional regulator with XRE-family HTH domain
MDTEDFQRELGNALRDLRTERGWTQQQVGKALGLKRTSITNIENGSQGLPLITFLRLTDHLGADVSQLLNDVRGGNALETNYRVLEGVPAEYRAIVRRIATPTTAGTGRSNNLRRSS